MALPKIANDMRNHKPAQNGTSLCEFGDNPNFSKMRLGASKYQDSKGRL
jgi:hypothetical protein